MVSIQHVHLQNALTTVSPVSHINTHIYFIWAYIFSSMGRALRLPTADIGKQLYKKVGATSFYYSVWPVQDYRWRSLKGYICIQQYIQFVKKEGGGGVWRKSVASKSCCLGYNKGSVRWTSTAGFLHLQVACGTSGLEKISRCTHKMIESLDLVQGLWPRQTSSSTVHNGEDTIEINGWNMPYDYYKKSISSIIP